MNAIVSKRSAGRRLGMCLIVLMAPLKMRAAEIVFTVEGTLYAGPDDANVFGFGKELPKGTPFKLVATFDDTKAATMVDGGCPESGSSIQGGAGRKGFNGFDPPGPKFPSPGKAVIIINGVSREFGNGQFAQSWAWRWFNAWCNNGPSKLGFSVMDRLARRPHGLKNGCG